MNAKQIEMISDTHGHMIHDAQELAASLDYAAKWADTLEDLRRHAQETDAVLLPTTSAGPLSEIRRVLAEAREFISGQEAPTELREAETVNGSR